ncbi:MAG: phospho-N-acetylmuramoyl-pentapeptide-transferase [Lactobacillales bacterium]|jgi:phospho-N-acetylmuramoyl-pentapeptide-transferase|nr:phospho-N-acetylmuramoyl-pentapeptide-transferase [Lactobacillales bacterium]
MIITINLIASLILSFVFVVFILPWFIAYFQRKKLGQPTLEDVKQHTEKLGTPTMGGVVFLAGTFITTLFSAFYLRFFSIQLLALLFVLVLYGLLGFLDDFLKVFRQQNEGLKPKQKFCGQILGGVIFFLLLMKSDFLLELNIFGIWHISLGWLYLAFIVFWMVGFSNAVNLTDGIDGLVSILMVISLSAYAVLAWIQEQMDILVLIVSLIGALLAFFLFNRKPAKIFMGDVGSLALGGVLSAISIQLHQEWTLLFIGIVYVLETLSVMLQVTYFKLTGGKRIFRMTPIHHHFELGGFTGKGKSWSEWEVNFAFWLVGLIGALVTLVYIFIVI